MNSTKDKKKSSKPGLRQSNSQQLPQTAITVYNMPGQNRVFLPTVPRTPEDDDSIESGSTVSEVGFSEIVRLKCLGHTIAAYNLRSRRKGRSLPMYIRGGCSIGETFSQMIPIIVSLPTVNNVITIDPVLPRRMLDFVTASSGYEFIRAQVVWVVHIPSPLGTALILRAWAPELDATTETRGVRWKPQSNTAIAFKMDWSSDIPFVRNTQTLTAVRDGQSGLSLKIQCVEDNSTEAVNTPLTATVWCCVYNVTMSGQRNFTEADRGALLALNFKPQSTP